MSGSNRSILAAFAGLAIAAAFLTPLIVDLTSVSAQAEHDAAYRADEYRKDANAYIDRRCLGLAFPASEDCTREAEQSARENQRIELDLAAQQMTAWWTQVMGVAALIGMALSAIGVWLVWTTFRETKRSADAAFAANNTLIEVERGILVPVGGNISAREAEQQEGKLLLGLFSLNNGSRPLYVTRVDFQFWRGAEIVCEGSAEFETLIVASTTALPVNILLDSGVTEADRLSGTAHYTTLARAFDRPFDFPINWDEREGKMFGALSLIPRVGGSR